MWPLIIGYRPGMEGSGDKDDEQTMTTITNKIMT